MASPSLGKPSHEAVLRGLVRVETLKFPLKSRHKLRIGRCTVRDEIYETETRELNLSILTEILPVFLQCSLPESVAGSSYSNLTDGLAGMIEFSANR